MRRCNTWGKKEQPCNRNGSGHIWTSQLDACYCYIDAILIILPIPFFWMIHVKDFFLPRGKKSLIFGWGWSTGQPINRQLFATGVTAVDLEVLPALLALPNVSQACGKMLALALMLCQYNVVVSLLNVQAKMCQWFTPCRRIIKTCWCLRFGLNMAEWGVQWSRNCILYIQRYLCLLLVCLFLKKRHVTYNLYIYILYVIHIILYVCNYVGFM